MDLPHSFRFQGWTIRYTVIEPKVQVASERARKDVVFVHGTPWSSTVYRPIIESLIATKPHRILAYDLPGYGKSLNFESGANSASKNGFPGDTSVRFQAEAFAALLKHVQMDGKNGASPPAVIAHDIAGAIVLRAHLLHGCDFQTMMLLDTNAVLPWGDGFYKLARSHPEAFVEMQPSIHEAVVRAVIRSACHNPKVLDAGWEDILAEPWISGRPDSQRDFVRQIAQADDTDVSEMLNGDHYKHVRCDVKILWGESDQWIPRHKIQELVARIGGRVKEQAFIPEAGHLVMLDQPARVAVEVVDWLEREGSPITPHNG